MLHNEPRPIRQYLDELREALRNNPTIVADALGDAREFLASELDSLRRAHSTLSPEEIYTHFVDTFGSPLEVAMGYIEPAAGCGSRRPMMNRRRRNYWMRIAATVLVVATTTVGICLAAMQEPPKLSPFTEVRYDGDKAIVRVRGDLYELMSLDDIAAASILQSSKDQFGDRWQKRFAEDLVEVLWGMDHRPKSTVKLQLRDLKSGETTTIADAAMTKANRQQIWDARNWVEEAPKLSPFTEVRYEGDKVIVRVRGQLYELGSLDDIAADKILQAAKDQFGRLWQKRFAEDLVEVLWGMGHRPKSTVKLQLRDLKTGELTTIADAAMTEANRRIIRGAGNQVNEPPKLAPFTEVRYEGDAAIVRVKGEMYELVSLDDIDAGKILQSAQDQFGNRWQKRFAEDLVEVLWGMDHRPKSTVKLELRNLKTGEVTAITDAPMTEANRQQVWYARQRIETEPRR